MVGYSTNEGTGEEREMFWNDMERTMDTLGNGYRLCKLEDLNRWIGDRVRPSINGTFGVPGKN